MVNHRDGGPDNRIDRRGGRRRERQSAARRPGDVDRFRRARGTRERPRRRLRGRRSGGRRLPRHGDPIGLRDDGTRSLRRAGRDRNRADCPADRTAARDGQRRRRGAAHLRAQRRRRADDDAAVEHHRRDVGGGQPPPACPSRRGDAYGFDDWSSNVAMRGFQVTINEAQIGTTVDGFPNGTSDYWGGSKANRFIDPMNLGGRRGLAGDGRHRLAVGRGAGRHVRLPDGRSGGGADLHRVVDARRERRPSGSPCGSTPDRCSAAARRAPGLAAVRQEATDWVEGSARNEREHVAAKLVSAHGRLDLTSYLSYGQHPRGCVPAALQRGRLPRQPAVGPPDRRVAPASRI